MYILIAFTNKTTRLRDYDVALCAWACNWQNLRDVAPAWGRLPRLTKFFPKGSIIPPTAWEIAFFDDASQAGTLGFHSVTPAGLPYGRVFVSPVLDSGGTLFVGENSCSAVASHEDAETFCDEAINIWADGPNNQDYALEVGDPVEADSYPMTYGNISVSVSNFVTLAWFDQTLLAGSKFDYMGLCTAPFEIRPNGYQIVRSNGQSSQLTARGTPNMARHDASHPASRSFKRLHRQKGTSHPSSAGGGT